MQVLVNLSFMILPSILKKLILKLIGHKISWSSFIGFSYVNIFGDIVLGNYTRISSFNYLNTHVLHLSKGSKLGSFNWIAGKSMRNGLIMGKCSSIRRFHYLDTTGGISLGANSIIAGRSTVMFTHGLSPVNLDLVRGIEIGDWVYVGARSNFLPGVNVADGIFIGMGSTVVGSLESEYSVYASNKAKCIKTFSHKDVYYKRPYISHKHLNGVKL